MQYYNYRIDRKIYRCNMFKDTFLVALGKRVVNLQILDPGSPRGLGPEIPRTVVALKQVHQIMGHTINQNSTNMYYKDEVIPRILVKESLNLELRL
jgi:hypothetical protein